MNNNGEPKVPMMVALPATSATIAPAIDSPAADVPVINVLTHAEIYAKQLELNAKRLGFNAKQLDLTDKQIELDEQERKLDDEQRELNAQSSVSVVFELMASASARTPAIPVIDAPTESISPCPPIAALPSLLVAALPAARPTAAQEGKRPAPTNESPESPIAPKRHRGSGQITNDGSATGSSLTTCRSLSEKIAVERLVAALDVPALVTPATDAPAFGNAPAAGALATDYSAVDISAYFAPTADYSAFVAPAAGALSTNYSAFAAPAVGALATDYSAVDFSALVVPAAGATTFGNAPAVGFSAVDFSAYFASAAGSTTFGYAPAVGISDLDISAYFAPAAGATTFGYAPAVGISAVDFSDLIATATGALTFGNALTVSISGTDISALVASAAGATMFGNAPAISVPALDISALVAPAAGATTFGNAPAIGVSALDFSDLLAPAAGAPTFGVAPAAGVLDRDISDLFAPAAGAPTFGNTPAIGVSAFGVAPAVGISAFGTPAVGVLAYFAPATGATTFGVAPTAGILDRDISALVAPATGATTFGNAPAADALAGDYSAFAGDYSAFAGDYSAFAAPAADALATDISAYVAPVDAAQFAAILNADQPIDRHLATQEWVHRGSRNYASESSQVVKRQRLDMCVSDSVTATNSSCMIYDVSGMVFDVSGVRVTSERLLVALGEAPFVGLVYVQDVYSHIYGCELIPSATLPQERIAMLASVVALEHWAPQLDEEGLADMADLSIFCRRDLERTELRQGFLEQLGLAANPNATVLGPRLCYVIVRMCAMSVDLLTGPVLRRMFMDVTGLDLLSLNVVTEKSVGRMSAKKLCRLVTKWVLHLCKFITDGGNGLEDSLSVATACNALYATRCSDGSSNNTEVALDMLSNNELYSTLFLGNQAADFEESSKRLLFVASGNISPVIKVYLEQLAMPLQIQPNSS